MRRILTIVTQGIVRRNCVVSSFDEHEASLVVIPEESCFCPRFCELHSEGNYPELKTHLQD